MKSIFQGQFKITLLLESLRFLKFATIIARLFRGEHVRGRHDRR